MKSYKQEIKHRKTRKRVLNFGIFLSSLILLFHITIDLVCYPECYFTTWKYQLKKDIMAGEQKAINYYQLNYINKGRVLFEGEVYINE